MNENLLKVHIELNSFDAKYLSLIKEACEIHLKEHVKKNMPVIREQILRMRTHRLEFQGVQQQMSVENTKKRQQTRKLKKQLTRLGEVQELAKVKYSNLSEEYEDLREKSKKLSEEIIEILQETKVFSIQVSEVLRKREIKNLSDNINLAAYEVKQLERSKFSAKQVNGIKRMDAELLVAKLKNELQDEKNQNKLAKTKLEIAKDRATIDREKHSPFLVKPHRLHKVI